MTNRVDDILRRNSLSVTESRKKILGLFLNLHGALAHGDGAVVLLHPWPDPVAPALDGIVAALREAGATFVRLDALDLPPGLEPIGEPRPAASAAAAG